VNLISAALLQISEPASVTNRENGAVQTPSVDSPPRSPRYLTITLLESFAVNNTDILFGKR
jgi:hypothetical protein